MYQKDITCESLLLTFIYSSPFIPLALNTIYSFTILKCICRPGHPSTLLDITTCIFHRHLKLKLSKGGHLSNPIPSRIKIYSYFWLPYVNKNTLSFQLPKLENWDVYFYPSPSIFDPLNHNQILSALHKNLPLILPLSNLPSLLTWNHEDFNQLYP